MGENKFKAKKSPKAVTQKCATGARIFKNKKLAVLDTPGFFDIKLDSKEIEDEIAKSYQQLAPGPHAVLIVLNVNRFTEEELKASERVTEIFTPEIVNYGLIVFTGLDQLVADGTNIEEYLGELDRDDPLNLLLDRYGRRYVAVNNLGTAAEKEQALDNLINEIKKMLPKQDPRYYSTSVFEKVADEVEKLKAKGDFNPIDNDGLIILYPGPKEIVGRHLRRNVGKGTAKT